MMNSEQYREHIERTFNAFCKIVLYHAALGIYKKIRRKQQFEVSLDYLREFDFEPIATTDEYFVKYDMPTTFTVRGETVIVESEQLAAALLRLPESGVKCCFAVLPRLQRYGNRKAVWSLQEYNLSQTEDCLALTAKRNGCVRK